MIVDTHTHFYDPFRPQGVPWPEKDDEILYRRAARRLQGPSCARGRNGYGHG